MKRVYILGENSHDRYHAVAYIRLLLPLKHPSLAEAFEVGDGFHLPDERFDIVIAQRFWREDITPVMAEQAVRHLRAISRLFLYEIDDNLPDLYRDQPWRQEITEAQRAAVRVFLRNADGVLVSTGRLGDRVARLNPNVAVLPNALDERLFANPMDSVREREAEAARSGTVVFGYMGAPTHTADLMTVVEPLRAVLRKYPDRVRFEVADVTRDPRAAEAFAGLPVRMPAIGESDLYPDFVRWARENMRWHFAIAPLADTLLNRCKSDIKFLDYSLLGIPGIYSESAAYADTVRDGETGILCRGGAANWQAALERIIGDPELRGRLAMNAYREVRENRVLETRATAWHDAIKTLWGGRSRPAVYRMEIA